MDYATFVSKSRPETRKGLLHLRTDIVAFAAALEFEPQTSLDWNLCIIAHAHGIAPRPSHLPREHEKELRGAVSLVVKCIIVGAPQNTRGSRNIKHVYELLNHLGVNFIKHKTNGRAVKKCRWCREPMSPEHRFCKDDNVGVLHHTPATYDSGEYTTLRYVTVYPPAREKSPRFVALTVLAQPIAEEVSEHLI